MQLHHSFSHRRSMLWLALFFAISYVQTCSAFAPIKITKSVPFSPTHLLRVTSTLNKHRSTLSSTSILRSNSVYQAEQHISNQYPKFYYLLQQNPTCLERIRESSRGFAIFAPNEETMDALGDSLNLLDYGCSDEDILPIVQDMVSYHVVFVPVTVDIMNQYNVVTTPKGELPVQFHQGSMYVNGVRVVQCYRFEDSAVTNYEDKEGNLLGSERLDEEGRVCLVYEMEGMVCPQELWDALYECYQSKNSGAGAI